MERGLRSSKLVVCVAEEGVAAVTRVKGKKGKAHERQVLGAMHRALNRDKAAERCSAKLQSKCWFLKTFPTRRCRCRTVRRRRD